jgi:hypothetical protein
MALYRFLFAPVLLAIAVLVGSQEGSGTHGSRAAEASAPPARRVEPASAPAAPSGASAAVVSAGPAAVR